MFSGSPRDLIMSSDMKVLTDKLSEIPDCSLFFRLCSHRKLLRAQHLVSENECIGRSVAHFRCAVLVLTFSSAGSTSWPDWWRVL